MAVQPKRESRTSNYVLMGVAAAIVLVLDQITKLWANSMRIGERMEVLPGWLRFRLTHNTGAAFGMLPDATGILSVISLLVIIGILVAFVRVGHPGTLGTLAAGLVTGGAVGNLIDRVRLGYVVDFVEVSAARIDINNTVYTFPIFNVADSGITVGVIIILAGLIFAGDSFLGGDQHAKEGASAHEGTSSGLPVRRVAIPENSAWNPAGKHRPATEVVPESSAAPRPTAAGWAGAAAIVAGFLLMALRTATRKR